MKSAVQWKVVSVEYQALTKTLDKLSASGWDVFSLIGPIGNMSIIAKRVLVLQPEKTEAEG